MKKILSLVLVAVLALGMTVTSFAAQGDVTVSGPSNVYKGSSATFTATVENAGGTQDPATGTVWSVVGGVAGTTINATTGVLKVASNETASTLDVTATVGSEDDTMSVTVDTASKKITGVAGIAGFGGAQDLGEIAANHSVSLVLDPSYFDWDTTGGAVAPAAVTEAQLRNAKITVKSTVTKGSSVIDKIAFDTVGGQAVVKIDFADPYVNTKATDFDFTVYLLKDKSRLEASKYNFTGTLKNTTIYVDSADDEVYIGDGHVAEATEYIKSIKVDLGNDFYLTTKMFDGKKYYGVATNEPTAADDDMLSKYPEIAVIYTIKQSGLNGATATFDLDDKMYVYNAEGKYLGTTADKLAFSSKYYLTTKKIDLATSEEVEEEEDDVTEAPVEEEKPANNNPDTGVNGMVNVAVVAGVVALAAAGAVVLKK